MNIVLFIFLKVKSIWLKWFKYNTKGNRIIVCVEKKKQRS